MTTPVSDLPTLLASMEPVLHPGVFIFATLACGVDIDRSCVVASIREPEGLSIIVSESDALKYGLQSLARCAWITLSVNSDLHAIGLTAAFSSVLGNAGISCNVVAGANHDHIFVPVKDADTAMRALRKLQSQAVAAV